MCFGLFEGGGGWRGDAGEGGGKREGEGLVRVCETCLVHSYYSPVTTSYFRSHLSSSSPSPSPPRIRSELKGADRREDDNHQTHLKQPTYQVRHFRCPDAILASISNRPVLTQPIFPPFANQPLRSPRSRPYPASRLDGCRRRTRGLTPSAPVTPCPRVLFHWPT